AADVCADAQEGTASVTVQDLTNGEAYSFWVVSIDEAKNASEPVLVGEATPAPEEDFWERYQRSGGSADGGGCTTLPGASSIDWLPYALTLTAAWFSLRRAALGRGAR